MGKRQKTVCLGADDEAWLEWKRKMEERADVTILLSAVVTLTRGGDGEDIKEDARSCVFLLRVDPNATSQSQRV